MARKLALQGTFYKVLKKSFCYSFDTWENKIIGKNNFVFRDLQVVKFESSKIGFTLINLMEGRRQNFSGGFE